MSHGLDCKVRVVDLVHQVKESQGGEGDENQNYPWKNCSDNLNLLRVEDVFVCKFGRDHCDDDVEHEGANEDNNH